MGLELKLNGEKLNGEYLEGIAGGTITKTEATRLKFACHAYKLGGWSKESSLKHVAECYEQAVDGGPCPTYEELVAWFDANWDSL